MSVNWSKEIDQTLAAAKEHSRLILLDFTRILPEERVLGWRPTRIKIRRPSNSSVKIPSICKAGCVEQG